MYAHAPGNKRMDSTATAQISAVQAVQQNAASPHALMCQQESLNSAAKLCCAGDQTASKVRLLGKLELLQVGFLNALRLPQR